MTIIKEPIRSPQEPVLLFNPNDEFLFLIFDAYQLNEVRIQIHDEKLEGYYVEYKGQHISIDVDGGISDWPLGFFDYEVKQLNYLLGI